MTSWMIVVLAVLTYLSRAASLVLLPQPSPRLQRVVARVPAPLFAGFAAISLVTTSRDPGPAETLAAVFVATITATRTKSLLAILAAGLAGFLVMVGLRTLL